MKNELLLDVVLPMLNTPKIDVAQNVIDTVYEYNLEEDLEDIELFKECASLIISELGL